MTPTAVSLRAASKSYGDASVLRDLDLDVPTGAITAVLGSSGSGKTTLLRVIAGFERLDAGIVAISGAVVDDGRGAVSARHRGVGYVPQEGALFPHLTVRGNIAFGLRRSRRGAVDELLKLIGMDDLEGRYPHELSGGQQQRVALARALSVGPALVLLDEPFAALDAPMRVDLRRDVVRILRERGTTALLVTHDQDEALALADEIALLADGAISACAHPEQLYRDPPTPAAAAALGQVNLLPAVVASGRGRCALGELAIETNGRMTPDGRATLMIRPEQLRVTAGDTDAGVVARVVSVEYYGHDALAELSVAGAETPAVLARLHSDADLAPGQLVSVTVAGAALAWSQSGPGPAPTPDDPPQPAGT